MWATRFVVLPRLAVVLTVMVLASPRFSWAQANLENPSSGSFQSGIGLVSGWKCTANTITVSFDGGPQIQAAYGTSREDTRSVCGKANTGFGLLFNWNLLGNGVHTVSALADGIQFASATFTVTTLGQEFLTGASGTFPLLKFPQPEKNVTVQWQESAQNFVITSLADAGFLYAGVTGQDTTCSSSLMPSAPRAARFNIASTRDQLSPSPRVEAVIDGDPPFFKCEGSGALYLFTGCCGNIRISILECEDRIIRPIEVTTSFASLMSDLSPDVTSQDQAAISVTNGHWERHLSFSNPGSNPPHPNDTIDIVADCFQLGGNTCSGTFTITTSVCATGSIPWTARQYD